MTLNDLAILLAALALAAPLARWLGIAAVLGYLVAGVLLGPLGAGALFTEQDAEQVLHFAEFGVVLLLFLIGLELRPKRLWAMRQAIFGLGTAQVTLTSIALGAIGIVVFGSQWQPALFAAAALALSSTAFALQVMEENGELQTRHGRLGFSVLLFQDLAAIPLIALAPYFAVTAAHEALKIDYLALGKGLATIVAVIVIGRYVLDFLLRVVALSKVKEAMTAAALLTVVGIALIMESVGLSPSLGAFIAGALLAESSYRHELEADIAPFEGLLLGIFFTAIGMSLNLRLIASEPALIITLTATLIAVKAGILYALGRWQGLEARPSRRLAFALSQGGEFAFVLLSVGRAAGVLGTRPSEILAVVVTLSMALTLILLMLDRLLSKTALPQRAFDRPPEKDGHVVIAGFGRFGQIVARVLRAKGVPFTALDISAEQIEFVSRFGATAFFGDASRTEVLEAAQIGRARAFVLAIDDVEAAMRAAAIVKANYPNVPIYARARDRLHALRLLDLGVTGIRRETFLASLDLTRELLVGLGYSERVAQRAVQTFRNHDERRLNEDYKHASDAEKLAERARSSQAMLEKLFRDDEIEEAKLAQAEKSQRDGTAKPERL
ncbi:glutathione-regulated potassium-efflux system protein KefB [Hyphomicrobium methylovorum]|uniref:monovalent cation:proton antiporter-2 (CPA2) family protein n=1 Tax=Hyphomicrobium methylovorum TaxID=84 RepID=UPI0015E6A643|nr:monovalent cation:proton antiporter-2 (CPA2) family protein [Hyphomicrobium methylovorum]MBA2124630.1 glutathione-regulated potassium-efflux system protein KefB [Hyphomicrobium methylovorum]